MINLLVVKSIHQAIPGRVDITQEEHSSLGYKLESGEYGPFKPQAKAVQRVCALLSSSFQPQQEH